MLRRMLSLACLMALLAYVSSQSALYRSRTDDNTWSSNYEQYGNAINSDLVDTAYRKRVSLGAGSQCSAGYHPILPAGTLSEGDITNTSASTGTTLIGVCNNICPNEFSREIPTITPVNSRQLLETSQNVVQTSLNQFSYVLTIRTNGPIQVNQEVTFISLGTQSLNLTIKLQSLAFKINKFQILIEDGLTSTTSDTFDWQDASHQCAFLVKNQRISIQLNNTELYSHQLPEALTRLELSPMTTAFPFTVENWQMYGMLTQQDLYYLRVGEVIDINPEGHCNCPVAYPLFERWPHNRDAVWRGTLCKRINGEATISRIPPDGHSPVEAVDGNNDTFWMSDGTSNLTRLDIDLGTTYNILYANILMLTVSPYMVLTKRSELGGPEEVLYVLSPNCSAPLPAGLPQGTPLRCEDQNLQLNAFNGHNSETVSINLDWIYDIYFENYVAHADRLLEVISGGRLKAAAVSLYMYGFTGQATLHAVNEIKIMGVCGCSSSGVCSLTRGTARVNAGRRKRSAALIINEPMAAPSDRDDFTFPEVFGFRCTCSDGLSSGPLCNSCSRTAYLSDITGECEDCGCSVGASSNTCDDRGVCTCDLAGGGDRTSLADDKCRPFVYSVTPSFGPVAGGTDVLLRGGWLENIESVYIELSTCSKDLQSQSNQTHFYCQTVAIQDEGSSPIKVGDTTTPVNFTFKANPNITAIGRVEVFISGGLPIPVTGTNLDSVSDPMIIVRVTCKINGEEKAMKKETCEVQSSTEMTCRSPDFSGTLDDIRCGGTASSRRKREVSSEESLFNFEIGFELDGLEDFNATKSVPWLEASSRMFVNPNPSIIDFDGNRIKVLEDGNSQLEIKGTDLDSGAELTDYTVVVGVGSCIPSSLYHNILKCELPGELPLPGSDYTADPDNADNKLPAVVVEVGNIQSQVGYLKMNASSSNIPLIAGITGGIVLLLLICIVIAVVLLRLKKKKFIKKHQYSDKRSQRYVPGPTGRVIMIDDDYLTSEHMNSLKDWMIERDHLEMSSALGQGQFGKVFLGSLKMKSGTQRKVACKTMKAELLHSDTQAVTNFLQEAILMKDFNHPNVLSLIGVVLNEQQLPVVIIPFMAKGDLKKVLRDESEEFTVGDLIHFGLQAANGMDYLAKKKFIHRDLAARNCMVNEQYMVKVADFGLSRDIYSEDYYRVQDRTKPLPVKWMAIESLTTGKYTVESDVWSYAVLLWEILTRGASPYPGVNNYEIKEHLKIGQRLSSPDFCPDEVYELMCACWEMVPTDRPTFEEISGALTTFMTENDEFERAQTKEIEDDYYTQADEDDDIPIYSATPNSDIPEPDYDIACDKEKGDYDIAMPVIGAPSTPSAVPSSPTSTQYFIAEDVKINANNNNSNTLVRAPSTDAPMVEEGYLTPTVSVKSTKKSVTKPTAGSRTKKASQASSKSKSSMKSIVKANTPPVESDGYLEPQNMGEPALSSELSDKEPTLSSERLENDYSKAPSKLSQRKATPAHVESGPTSPSDDSTDFYGARSRLKLVKNKRPSAKEQSGTDNSNAEYLEVF